MDHNAGEWQAIVALSAVEGNDILIYPERKIRFSSKQPAVTVGRASKAPSKGLLPAIDNLLFDSPVMSRNHAELVADLDQKTVSIRDLGSMHGTFVNEEILSKDATQIIASGDKIRFGVGIDRGHERFIPTTVNVDIGFSSSSLQPVTFEVPDASESESDDIVSVRDDEDSDDDVIITSSATRTTNCVDLTSPIRELSPDSPPAMVAPAPDLTLSASVPPDNTHQPSEADLHDKTLDQVEVMRALSPESEESYSDEDDHDEFDNRVAPYLSNQAESELGDSDNEDDDRSDIDSDEEDFSPPYGSDISVQPKDYLLDAVSDSEDESVSNSDQEEACMDEDELDSAAAWDPADSESEDLDGDEEPWQAEDLSLPPIEVFTANSTHQKLAEPAGQAPSSRSLAPSTSVAPARVPSPSDAALIKSIRAPLAASLIGQTYQNAEFFAARADNRAKAAERPMNPISGHSGPSICSSTPDGHQSSLMVLLQESSDLDLNSVPPVAISPLLLSGQQFLCSPLADEPVPDNSGSDHEEAMTSAAVFEICKRSKQQSNEAAGAPPVPVSPSPRRTHLGISELLTSHPKANSPPPPPKRKLAEISDVTAEDSAWATNASGVVDSTESPNAAEPHAEKQGLTNTGKSAPKASKLPPSATDSPAGNLPMSQPAPTQHNPCVGCETRPLKRLRTLAKQAGIAALGSITVGAMVFGSMVYMAPDF